MTNKKYRQGAEFENQVADMFDERGFVVVRAAGSGTTPRVSPDLIAVNDKVVILMECKSYTGERGEAVIKIDKEQIHEMVKRVSNESYWSVGLKKEVIVVMKSVDGGITEYAYPDSGPIMTGEETYPLYEIIERYE